MRLLFGHDAEVAHWVALRIPHMRPMLAEFPPGQAFGPMVALGVLDDHGTLVAGCVYHGYNPHFRTMEISCAADGYKWTDREIVRALLRHPFHGANCQRLTAITPRRATSARRFLEKLGFKREGSVRRGFGSDNAIIYGLLAEEWAAHPINQGRAPSGGGG